MKHPSLATLSVLTILAVSPAPALAGSRPCPLDETAREGDTCASAVTPASDPLRLGAATLEYTQEKQRDRILSRLAVFDAKGVEVASIDHTLFEDPNVSPRKPYATAYDYLFVAQVNGLRGELGPDHDTITPDPVLRTLGGWLQAEAGVWYLPLKDPKDLKAIDEVACMLLCLAGCSFVDAPCWQACSAFCSWLVLTPL